MLHVVDGLGLSGKTRQLVSLAARLDRRRFAPVVCRLNTEPSPLLAELDDAGVPVHTIAAGDGVNVGVPMQLARLAWTTHADIVQCWNPRPMLYGGIAARAIGIRSTVGFLSAFACQVPDRAYGFLPQPLSTVSRRNVYRNRLGAATMRSIVAVSQTLGKRFCEYNGVPVDKLHVIPYGVDVAALDPATAARASALRARLGLGPDHVVVGSVGRLVEQKDYPTQLRAFARAAVHVPALRMVIAGDGPLRSTLEELVRELRLDGRVTLLGNWHDVPALLRSLDAFVLASKFEPFGVALLEARSAGLAIVATAVNEIPTIVRDGVNGLLTPPENAATMAARFVVLARDRNLRQRLGAEARADARRHSLAAVVHAYERLYDASLEHAIGPAFARSTHA